VYKGSSIETLAKLRRACYKSEKVEVRWIEYNANLSKGFAILVVRRVASEKLGPKIDQASQLFASVVEAAERRISKPGEPGKLISIDLSPLNVKMFAGNLATLREEIYRDQPNIASIRETIVARQLYPQGAEHLVEREFVASAEDADSARLLGQIALKSVGIERERQALQELVNAARARGVMWADIGGATSLSSSAALRHFDIEKKQKNLDSQRKRQAGSA
jgi:hypothetical protein